MFHGITGRAIALLATATVAMSGCGSDDKDEAAPVAAGPSLPNYTTGPVRTQPAVVGGAVKVLQNGTADTHEVGTDGDWIVWKGRSINLSFFDGTSAGILDTGLPNSVAPWAFDNNCELSPVVFDGVTIAMVARDTGAAAYPAFYFLRPGSAASKVSLPTSTFHRLQDYSVHVSGTAAAVRFGGAVYAVDLSAASPAFGADLMPVTGTFSGFGGGFFAVAQAGNLDVVRLSDGTVTSLTGDADVLTPPSAVRFANGTFTWVENGKAYAFDVSATDSSLVSASLDAQSDPVAGPGYFLWNEAGTLKYLSRAIGSSVETVGLVATASTLQPGAGFFAYIANDADGRAQIYAYALSDLTATAGVAATLNGKGAAQPSAGYAFHVDGSRAYAVFQYESVEEPSKVLVVYDFATGGLKELTKLTDFQQVPVVAAAGGKAVFLHRDFSFRLFAKQASASSAPVAFTPPALTVEQFVVANGKVVFRGLDRAAWDASIREAVNNAGNADVLTEVYVIDLNGARTQQRLTFNGAVENNPQTDGRFITWYDDGSRGWAYDLSNGQIRMIATNLSDKVVVDGGIAAWKYNNGIHYFNLNTGASGQLYAGSSISKCPAIADGVVVWNDNYKAYYYDFNAAVPAATEIVGGRPSFTNYGSEYQAPVATDGNYVTWVEYRASWDHDGDAGATTPAIAANVVVVYDLAGARLFDLPAADWTQTGTGLSYSEDGKQGAVCFPRISNGIVAFNAIEYGVDNVDVEKEIFFADVTAAVPTVVRVTSDAHDDAGTASVDESAGLWDSNLDLANGLIVWRTGGSGSYWNWDGKTVAAARVQ